MLAPVAPEFSAPIAPPRLFSSSPRLNSSGATGATGATLRNASYSAAFRGPGRSGAWPRCQLLRGQAASGAVSHPPRRCQVARIGVAPAILRGHALHLCFR